MKILDTCTGCGSCLPYCPMGAIHIESQTAVIESDTCVECGVCLKSGICAVEAFEDDAQLYPMRLLRRTFSNPRIPHPQTNVTGRGTEEMKTNEITNRFQRGVCGIIAEMGRPGLGVRFKDVQTVAQACLKEAIELEPYNPVTKLMTDQAKGIFPEEILKEKVMSAMIEFICPNNLVAAVLGHMKEASGRIDSVFSLDICCRAEEDGSFPMYALAAEAGLTPYLNSKNNVGLGRMKINL